MKKLLPYISSIVLVVIGFLLGAILTGNNAIAQKIAAITGNGTQDRLAKWINNSGTLGNSSISEDKRGNLTIGGNIKFPDGSIQTTAATSADSHFQQLKFNGAAAQLRSFQLPMNDSPVRIEVSVSNLFRNGNGIRPSLFSSEVIRDSATGKVNGIFGPISIDISTNDGLSDIFFQVHDDGRATLQIIYNLESISSDVHYTVNMWY